MPDALGRLALLGVSLAMWWSRLEGPLDLRWDAAVYYVTGVALADGRGYSLLNEPGDVAAVQYPPGLPAVVAATSWLSGSGDPAIVASRLRIVWFLLSLAWTQLAFTLARRWLAPGAALLAALVATLSFPACEFSELLFAELPLAVVVTLFLLGRAGPASRARSCWLAALAAAGFLLRTLGAALLAAWVGESLLARRWRSAGLRLAVAALPILAWKAYVASVTSSDDYLRPAYEYQRASYQFHNVPYETNLGLVDPFVPELGEISIGGWARRISGNVADLPASVGESLATTRRMTRMLLGRATGQRLDSPPIALAAYAGLSLLGVLALIGVVALAARRERRFVLALAFGGAIVCATPWPAQFARYLMPFGAPLAVAWVLGLRIAAGPASRSALARVRRGAAGLLVAALLVLELFSIRAVYRTRGPMPRTLAAGGAEGAAARPFFYDRAWEHFDRALDWIRDHSDSADVVATSEAHYASIRTGRDAVLPPFSADPEEALRLLDTVPVRYVVIDRFPNLDVARRYALPAMLSDPSRWERVLATDDDGAQVFRRRK